jgi:hypothetical protein
MSDLVLVLEVQALAPPTDISIHFSRDVYSRGDLSDVRDFDDELSRDDHRSVPTTCGRRGGLL